MQWPLVLVKLGYTVILAVICVAYVVLVWYNRGTRKGRELPTPDPSSHRADRTCTMTIANATEAAPSAPQHASPCFDLLESLRCDVTERVEWMTIHEGVSFDEIDTADLAWEAADAALPVYTFDWAKLVADCPALLTDEPDCGPAGDHWAQHSDGSLPTFTSGSLTKPSTTSMILGRRHDDRRTTPNCKDTVRCSTMSECRHRPPRTPNHRRPGMARVPLREPRRNDPHRIRSRRMTSTPRHDFVALSRQGPRVAGHCRPQDNSLTRST